MLLTGRALAAPALPASSQTPLKVKGQRATLELRSESGLFATTSIAIGNPPQVFQAIVDIGASDIFVPGTDCTSKSLMCKNGAVYDALSSTTSVHDDERTVAVDRHDRYTAGILSRDSIHVGGVEVKNRVFERAEALTRNVVIQQPRIRYCSRPGKGDCPDAVVNSTD